MQILSVSCLSYFSRACLFLRVLIFQHDIQSPSATLRCKILHVWFKGRVVVSRGATWIWDLPAWPTFKIFLWHLQSRNTRSLENQMLGFRPLIFVPTNKQKVINCALKIQEDGLECDSRNCSFLKSLFFFAPIVISGLWRRIEIILMFWTSMLRRFAIIWIAKKTIKWTILQINPKFSLKA